MVSTASRVGTGNIAGISTALCIGGPGSHVLDVADRSSRQRPPRLWKVRWLRFIKRGRTTEALTEVRLYYIQAVLKKRWIGILFAVVLIVTYMGGFNMVAAFNIADTFKALQLLRCVHDAKNRGGVLAIAFPDLYFRRRQADFKGYRRACSGDGSFYIAVSLFIVITHINLVPGMIADIVKGAFDFKAILEALQVPPLCRESREDYSPTRPVSVPLRTRRHQPAYPIRQNRGLCRCFPFILIRL